MKAVHTSLVSVAFVCLAAVLLTGCGLFRWMEGGYGKPVVVDEKEHAEANRVSHRHDVATRHLVLASEGIGLLGDIGGLRSMRFQAHPYTALTQHSFAEEGGDFDPALSPDSRRFLFASTCNRRNADIYVKNVSGTTITQLTDDLASDLQPVFSPDQRTVAFTSNRNGNWDIFVMGVDGRNVVQVTRGTDHEMHPTFSPDGKRLAYCSYSARQDRWELWVVNLTNTAEKSLIGFGLFPVWSPRKDKDVIAFQRARQRGSRWFGIWTCELQKNEARNLTEIVSSTDWAAVAPSFSPDGLRLAFTTVDATTVKRGGRQVRGEDIWIVGIDGYGRMQMTSSGDADWAPAWGKDGRIYFCSNRGGKPNVWSVKPMVPPLPQGKSRLTEMGPTPAAGGSVAAAAAAPPTTP